ncbi:sulfurtransferase TusA family protein [Syntrophomonas palmitatica]|uniref:sulfurtransferase TusA family protein n=1 Tax=Syntrophomonas palmitatica TaxID=402877 RepID=UPI0006D2CAE8|nr:sulfurtransferase TusA family protein [Syntrophomonas palmitatica]
MEKLDVRGLSCPLPVIKTKKLIDAGVKEILVMGSGAVARENVSKLAQSMGYACEVGNEKKADWEMQLKKS